MRKLYFLYLLTLTVALQAQVQFTKLEMGDKSSPMDISYLVEPEMVKGTPLGFDEWRKGKVVVATGDTSKTYLINYHTLGDVVYFKDVETDELYKTDESSITALLIENEAGKMDLFERVLWQNFAEFPKDPRICEILVRKNGFELIKYIDKELTEPDEKENIHVSRLTILDYYAPKERYFWRPDSDSQFEELSFNKNMVAEVLNKEQQNKAKDYQKKNKVRWNKEAEVIAMLNSIL